MLSSAVLSFSVLCSAVLCGGSGQAATPPAASAAAAAAVAAAVAGRVARASRPAIPTAPAPAAPAAAAAAAFGWRSRSGPGHDPHRVACDPDRPPKLTQSLGLVCACVGP